MYTHTHLQVKMEHNQIEQAGGEVLLPAIKRLEPE